jgi:hypothetical protein
MVLITNHTKRSLSLLASQFRSEKSNGDMTNFQKMIKCFSDELQEAEDVNQQLLEERWLENAIGKQLDMIGEILDLPRQLGESDDDYRERLQFQIFINSSNGTPEDVIETLKFLTKSSYVNYLERDYGFFQLEMNGIKFPNPPNDLNEVIKKVSPAGVNYAPIVATYGVPIPFELSGDLSSDPLVVNPSDDAENHLEMEPYLSILYVSAGNVTKNGPNGGLDELNYPLPTAGQISELIQKGGNLIPPRYQ